MYDIAKVTTFTFFHIIDFYHWQRLSTEQNYLLAKGANVSSVRFSSCKFFSFYRIRFRGQLSYILFKPQRVSVVLRRFRLKMGTDFAHFNLESDMVYEGAIQECIKVSLDLIPNKKERESNMWIRNRF